HSVESAESYSALRLKGAYYRYDTQPGHTIDGMRRFDADHLGDKYGEKYLSGTFEEIPSEQREAVLAHAIQGTPQNKLLRAVDVPALSAVENKLAEYYLDTKEGWNLYELNDGRVPTMDDIRQWSSRTDLTETQARLVRDVLDSKDPDHSLEKLVRQGSG